MCAGGRINGLFYHVSNRIFSRHPRKTFQKYDTAKNGVLSFDEFKAALQESDLQESMLVEVFESIDVNNTGHLNYTGKWFVSCVKVGFCKENVKSSPLTMKSSWQQHLRPTDTLKKRELLLRLTV